MQKLSSRFFIKMVGFGSLIWLITCSMVAAQPEPAQIMLDASMLTIEPGVGLDDEIELVDEQDQFPAGTCDSSWENWGNPVYPQSVYLDLGQEYVITQVHLFNHGGEGDFLVSSGTPGNWSVFVRDALIGYSGWEGHSGFSVTTRFIRCTKTTAGKMAELVLIGYPVTGTAFNLSVSVIGNGSVSPPSGDYLAVTITVLASPDSGWRFDHWEGDLSGATNPQQITMAEDRIIVAVFVEDPGTGESIKLPLIPDMMVDEKSGGYSETPDTNLVDEQTVAADPRSGAGGSVATSWMPSWHQIDYPWSCYIDLGQSHRITDIYLFDHEWKAGDFSVSYGSPGNWTILFTDGLNRNNQWFGQNVDVNTRYLRFTRQSTTAFVDEVVVYGTAVTETDEWHLYLTVSGNGSTDREPDLPAYPDGSQVRLTATPAAGSRFSYWVENGQTDTSNPLIIAMNADRNLTAVFEPVTTTYELSVNIEGNGTVSPGSGIYPAGQALALTANPGTGWNFENWSGDASGTENPLQVLMDTNRSITANFAEDTGGQSQMLLLTASMVVDEKPGGYAATPATNLVDEQGPAGDPRAGTGGAVATEWMPSWDSAAYPWPCYIDLGQTYNITDIYLYDHEWKSGDFSVSYGAPGNWVVLFTDGLNRNSQWFGQATDITTRYLRFTRHSTTSFVDEVVVYGTPGAADAIPPGAIPDLAAVPVTADSIALSWTATGDDGADGTATLYDVRYSTTVITDATWEIATRVAGEPSPAMAGTVQSMTVFGLAPDTTYYFAVRAFDDASNPSPLSNVPQATTLSGTGPQLKTFGGFLASIYLMDMPAERINMFRKMRMYLHTPVIAQNASGPGDLAFDPVDAWFIGQSLDTHLQGRIDNGTGVMVVLETVPPYMGLGGHAVAAPPGSDTTDPASFAAHAEMCFQVAARYGSREVPLDQISVRSGQAKKTGLGIMERLQPYNETWEFWEGSPRTFIRPDGTVETRSTGDWAPEEEAAMMVAAYDRIKQADPDMIVVWPSWLKPDPDQMRRVKSWLDVINGGQVPADEIAFTLWWNNVYPNNDDYTQTLDWSGAGARHPESNGGLKNYCDNLVNRVQALFPGVDVVISENGYDSDPSSPQGVPAIGSKSVQAVQADWLVRSYLAIFASRINHLYQYQIDDAPGGGLFAASGLVAADNITPKISWYFTATVLDVLQNAVFEAEVSSGRQDVMIYQFRDIGNDDTIFAVWCPTADGRVVNDFSLPVSGPVVTAVNLVNQNTTGQRSMLPVSAGSVSLDVTETPVFLIVP